MLLVNIQKLEQEMYNEKFLLRGSAFIEMGQIKFTSKKQAIDFLTKFLLVESIAGVDYSYKDIAKNYRQIKKMVKKGTVDSEKIPVVAPKTPADKELQNVYYHLEGNVCTYEKAC